MILTPPACPFTVELNQSTRSSIDCQQILRFLPEKRCVVKGQWQDRTVLVKLFQHPTAARRHWQREKQGVESLVDAGIPTPELLYAGELTDHTPVLVFEFLPQAQNAAEYWQQCNSENEHLDLLKRLSLTIAQLHQQGIWQQDLHLGNFLLDADHVYTIDGDGIRGQAGPAPLAQASSKENLALFLAQISPQYDHLFPDVIATYTQQRRLDSADWQDVLTRQLPICRKKRRDSYVKKSFRTCSEFIRCRQRGQVTLYRRDAPPGLIQQLLDAPDQLIAQGKPLKLGNSATVVLLETKEGNWVVKRYNIKNLWHAVKRCLRPTRASVSWGNAHRLKISGISTPSAVAMVEKRFGGLRFTGYYVCEFTSAPDALSYFSSPQPSAEEKHQTAQQFADLFTIFHRLGIYHGDCKATNFLVEKTTPWVIDLDAMCEFNSREQFIRHYRRDRDRFLRNWDDQPELYRWFDRHLPETNDN
jgi:tRNA A-37 threonylcarbamoyl transferase component Bud32